MKRKSSLILVVAVLGGVAATAFLAMSLFGEEHSSQRSALRSSEPTRVGAATDPGRSEGIPSRRQQYVRIPGRNPTGSDTPPDQREPWDSPGTAAERREWSSRVIEILGLIQGTRNVTERQRLLRELQKLIRKLGRRVPQTVRDDLLRMLTEVDPTWRPLIGDTIGGLQGDKDTAQKLVDMLKGRPELVQTRTAILRALGKMNVQEVLPQLNKMLRADFENEDGIVRAMASIGGRDAAAMLSGHLTSALIPKTRTALERALAQLRNPGVLERMEEDLSEVTGKARTSYVKILGMTRNPKYAPGVRRVLEEESDPSTRKAAIRALGFMGDSESGAVLLKLVQFGSPKDRKDATRAVYHIRDPKTVDAMAEHWFRLSDDARLAVIGAGSRLVQPTERLKKIAMESLDSKNGRVRIAAAQLLGKSRNDSAVDALTGFGRAAGTSRERTSVLQALLRIKTKRAARAALGLLPSLSLTESQRKYYTDQFDRMVGR